MTKQIMKKEAGETMEAESIPAIGAGGTGNVTQIRDILFGGQMREYERRFARLEARLDQEMATLKENVRKQLEFLDDYVKKEFTMLSEHLSSEQQKRERAIDGINGQIKQVGGELKDKLHQIEGETQKNFREIRHSLLDQAKTMTDEVDRKISITISAMNNADKELRAEKVDRTTLSNLFNELAMRIGDEEGFAGILNAGEIENDG